MSHYHGSPRLLIAIGLGLLLVSGCGREQQPVAKNEAEKKSQPSPIAASKPAPATIAQPPATPPAVIYVGPPLTTRKLEVTGTGVNGGRIRAKYETVKKGMTRAQVEAALGKGTVITIDEADNLVTLGGIERELLKPLTFVRWGKHPDPALIDTLVVGFSADGKARCKGYRSRDYVSGDGAFEPLNQAIKLNGKIHYLD